ncbi:MAG: GSCFA domain-containing protein [Bacteroidales bacterium]|nr:GSCFA domain-containing protein [Bacteroidales bacterium]
MKLQTIVDIPAPDFQIGYNDQLVFLGSCFANTIGSRINECKIPSLVNPFGVLYNPASVCLSLHRMIKNRHIIPDELQCNQDIWFSYTHYSSFNSTSKETCLNQINNSIEEAHLHIKNSNIICITLGTAWIFQLIEDKSIVSNCHKTPANQFQRRKLDVEEIIEYLSKAFYSITQINPNAKFIITISPIRHWKDGAIENQVSKSSLLLATHELKKAFRNLYYFPVYELFMDEMRDYRFYADDMLHPSTLSQEIIWDKFQDTFFDSQTKKCVLDVKKIRKSLQHKITDKNSSEFQKFTRDLENKILRFESSYPSINIEDFKHQLDELS